MSAPDQDNQHQQHPPSQPEPHQTSTQTQAQDHAVQPPPPAEPGTHTAAATPTTEETTTAVQRQQQEQEQEQPPASPPLPQKHALVTPGPRATRFTQLYDLALQRTLQKVAYDNFAACFPTIAAHAPNTLRNVQKQMVDYLEERCNKDFQSILDDRDVIRKLNEFENLVSDAERRRQESGLSAEEPIPPHLLPPDDVLAAHLAPRLASQQSHLNARLQNTQASNESLFAAIQAQRAEIDALLAQLENHVADIDGANAMLVDVAPELAAEARASEAQMSRMS
ncbi:Mind kinetochore complex component [Colletotrichum higginsianum IMI 349063]|uniref:Mind kinetochore complex component n=2 Tax=Colletotrichum higginsianum TaxID=80884 RepID=A0A1B7YNT3_COLHI|nr:Mind kinetochore complex component [Colletotrichum higginsianum IMI 349063]OBR13602.1 Mind kinetochore complex component [Colletotrichum higginsianum IMI 349063]TID01463.1 Kinetochore-associated protein NNF1 [Colletotrichum higginsianum]